MNRLNKELISQNEVLKEKN